MKERIELCLKKLSLWQFIFILSLAFIILNFIISAFYDNANCEIIFYNYLLISSLLFISLLLLFFIFFAVALFLKPPDVLPRNSIVVLSPIILLGFWPAQEKRFFLGIPIIVVALTQIIFLLILRNRISIGSSKIQKYGLLIAVMGYFFVMSYLCIKKFDSFAILNPKDFAIYNQSFWNAIHGRPFTNTAYGSNFACHNTWFFVLLMPFYYLAPGPLTLSILKILLLSLSAVPFYFIAKDILGSPVPLPLILSFLAYPFLVTQNFTPPHEAGFAPLFIMYTYYFFQTTRFLPFLCFLLLTFSIKEHMILLGLCLGIYAFVKKKGARWIITPLLLGIIWGIFSLSLITYFQKVYHSHPDANWFLVSIQRRFLSGGGGLLKNFIAGISSSNLSGWYKAKTAILLFSPLGLILPLLGPASILGLPEIALNLISDRPAMFDPVLHYNILASCFLLIGTIQAIKKISASNMIRKLSIETPKIMLLISVFIFSSVIMHSYTWLPLLQYEKNTASAKTIQKILSFIPPDASVSAPSPATVLISGRKEYFTLGDGKLGDYIIVIDGQNNKKLTEELRHSYYQEIFNRENILVYKKIR